MPNRIAVPSSDFIRNVGKWQDEALRQPVYITHHGRERLVLTALDGFSAPSLPNGSDEHPVIEQRAALDAVLENTSDAFFAVSESLEVVSSNAAAAMMVMRTRDDMRGAPIGTLFADVFARVLVDRLRRAIRLSKVESFESSALEGRHVVVRIFPMPGGAGFFVHNLTEMSRLARDHEELAAMKAALNVSHAAMIILDAAGRVSEVDETFAQWNAFDLDRIVGHRFVDVVSADDRARTVAILSRTVTTGEAECCVVRLLDRSGESVVFNLGVSAIFSEFSPRGHCLLMQSAGLANCAKS